MANRTTHKLKSINLAQQDVIDRQTRKITALEEVIQQHEAARRIEADRLEAASTRANAAEVTVAELTQRLETLQLAHKINTETLAVYATPVVVKEPSQDELKALEQGEFVDVTTPGNGI